MRFSTPPRFSALLASSALMLLLASSHAVARENVLLYDFTGTSDGSLPVGLVADAAGNLYGVATASGQYLYGTVYELSPPPQMGGHWKEQTLHTFGGDDGINPNGALIFDPDGNLYGTTTLGGSLGGGTVFQLKRPPTKGGVWEEHILYNFPYLKSGDGSLPWGAVVFDQSGNLYGTTANGGNTACYPYGCGTVFQLKPPAGKGGAWTESLIYVFQGTNDGAFPMGNLVGDAQGNLYGTSSGEQYNECVGNNVCGSVFELTPPQNGGAWTENTLTLYQSNVIPSPELTMDEFGNLYGTTEGDGWGTVFELSPPKKKAQSWTNVTLYSFKGLSDGAYPEGGVIFGADGNLYGTTANGGDLNCYPRVGCGTVFRLTKQGKIWVKTTLWKFTGRRAAHPTGDLIWGSNGLLYGTARAGGAGSCDNDIARGCGGIRQFAP